MITCLNNNIIDRFENIKNYSKELNKNMTDSGFISPEIKLDMDAELTEGIYANFPERKIILNRKFLNYLWALCYSIFYITEKFNEECIKGTNHGDCFLIDSKEKQYAYEIFQWALSVKNNYTEYPTNLPNPSNYTTFTPEIQEFVGLANGIYTFAVSFLMAHEFAHLTNLHDDIANLYLERKIRDLSDDEILLIRDAEKEADNFALEYCFDTDGNIKHKLTSSIGFACSFLSNLFLDDIRTVKKTYHPDTDERLKMCLNKIELPRSEYESVCQIICNFCIQFFEREGIVWSKFDYQNIDDCFSDILNTFDNYK